MYCLDSLGIHERCKGKGRVTKTITCVFESWDIYFSDINDNGQRSTEHFRNVIQCGKRSTDERSVFNELCLMTIDVLFNLFYFCYYLLYL